MAPFFDDVTEPDDARRPAPQAGAVGLGRNLGRPARGLRLPLRGIPVAVLVGTADPLDVRPMRRNVVAPRAAVSAVWASGR